MKFPYDKSSKWLLTHHGDKLLRLAGCTAIATCRAVQTSIVQPQQLPDGLLDVHLVGQEKLIPFLVEIATYADNRVPEQIARDLALTWLARQELPDGLVVVLRPKGQVQVTHLLTVVSALGWTRLAAGWKVLELWKLEAEQLLATEDPGLMPWVALTHMADPPERVLQKCREILDRKAKPEEQINLLAVSQVLGRLVFDRQLLMAIFGGQKPMIESPLIQELYEEASAKTKQDDLLAVLDARIGPVPEDLVMAIRGIADLNALTRLIPVAARCADFAGFRQQLPI